MTRPGQLGAIADVLARILRKFATRGEKPNLHVWTSQMLIGLDRRNQISDSQQALANPPNAACSKKQLDCAVHVPEL